MIVLQFTYREANKQPRTIIYDGSMLEALKIVESTFARINVGAEIRESLGSFFISSPRLNIRLTPGFRTQSVRNKLTPRH